MIKVMMMVDRPVPTDHSFLQGCVENYLGRVFDLFWLGPASKDVLPGKKMFAIKSSSRLGLYWGFLLLLPRLILHVRREKIGVIFVRNDPVFAIFTIFVRLFISIKFVYQLSHLKEEQVLQKWEGEYLFSKGSRFFAQLSRLFRNFVIVKADLFIPVSQSMLDRLSFLNFLDVKVMGLGFDPAEFNRSSVNEFKFKFPYIIYVGTLDPIRNFELTLRGFAKYVESCDDDLKLLVVGGARGDPDRERCVAYVKYLGIKSRVLFLDRVPRLEMIGLIKGALAGLSIIPPIGVNKTISPTKLFEYMGASIPIIVSSGIPAQDEVVSFYTESYMADDEEQIAKAIECVVNKDSSLIPLPPLSGFSRYSYENMANELISYIRH